MRGIPSIPILAPGAGLLILLAPLPWLGDLRIELAPFLALVTGATILLHITLHLLGKYHIEPSRGSIIAVALLLRLAMLPMLPSLSDDAYRYLWDGRLVLHGVSPYTHVPADPALARFHDDLLLRQGYPTTNTIYPPAAQLLFAASMAVGEPLGGWWGGYFIYKLLLIGMEMIAILLLLTMLERLGSSRRGAILYAWHPLVVVELAGQGHTDVLWVLSIGLALYGYTRHVMGGGLPWLALGAAARLYPLMLAPLWWRFLDRRARLAGMLLSLPIALLMVIPFLDPVALTSYTTVLARFTNFYEFNGGFYYGVKWILDELHLKPSNAIAGSIGTGVQLALLLALWLRAPRNRSTIELAGGALLIVTAQIVFGAKVHIWYFVAPLYVLALLPRHALRGAWLWGALIAPFTYLIYATDPPAERLDIVAIEWGGFALLAIYGAVRGSRWMAGGGNRTPVSDTGTGGRD